MMWGVSFWPRIILTERFKTNLSSMLAQMPHSTKQHDDDVGHHEEYNGSQVESREASRVGKRLSWVTRLRIARDVAASIEYLHLRRDTMIVHRDIKGTIFIYVIYLLVVSNVTTLFCRWKFFG
jgi:serine/threonine protein kinase